MAQLLTKKQDGGGRVAVNEILAVNSAVSSIVLEGATQKLQDVIVGGQGEGMQFMDDAIWEQLVAGTVSAHEAYMKAIDKQRFKAFLPPEEEGARQCRSRSRRCGPPWSGKKTMALRARTLVDEIKKALKPH